MPLTTDYYLTMTDSYGDGWNGNVLAFKQGNIIKTFGQEMAAYNMRTFGPIPITLSRFQSVSVTVYTLGSKTNEVGFSLRTASGLLVASRTPGTSFSATSVLGTFCPDCLNLNPVD